MKIKTPCPKCGKRKMIKSIATMSFGYLEIRVLNRCYKCGWRPPQQFMRRKI